MDEKETEKENVILEFKFGLVFFFFLGGETFGLVFLLFLFKIHLDLNSYDFWFLILVLIFFI